MIKKKFWKIYTSLIIFCLPMFIAAQAVDWYSVGHNDSDHFRQINGSSGNNIYIVHSGGTISHYDGYGWLEKAAYPELSIENIWCYDAGNLFLVGEDADNNGLIVHYDGEQYTTMHTEAGDIIKDVWGSAPNNVYAVGLAGAFLHYDGSTWTKIEVDPGLRWNEIYGVNENLIYLVERVTNEIYTFDGNSLQHYTTCPGKIGSFWASGANEIFTVFEDEIRFYNGTTWVMVKTEDGSFVYDIWGTSSTDVFFSGEGSLIYHYSGSDFTKVKLDDVNHTMQYIWGSSHNDIWATSSFGTLYHYDGNSWDLHLLEPMRYNYRDIHGTDSTNFYAVGDSGSLYHNNGNGWKAVNVPTANEIRGVWAVSSTDVFTVGRGGEILHYDGIKWEKMESSHSGNLNAVWAENATNVFAVGDNGAILRYNGDFWYNVRSVTNEKFNDVYGTAYNDVYMVGDNGTIIWYNGSAYMFIHTPMVPPGSYNSVHASQRSNVVIGGKDGMVLTFNGMEWLRKSIPTDKEVMDVYTIARNVIYVVGKDGTSYFVNKPATPWQPLETNVNYSLNALWKDNNGRMYSVGDMGTMLLHYTDDNVWQVGVAYKAGDIVTHDGNSWKCNIEHTSQSDWYPGCRGLWLWEQI